MCALTLRIHPIVARLIQKSTTARPNLGHSGMIQHKYLILRKRGVMHVALVQPVDLPAWLELAAEVEFLFGPMVADPAFHAALERPIRRQTAFCVREQAGAAGTPLMGAILSSATRAPSYK